MKTYYEQGRLDKKLINEYCKGSWEECLRYKLEEKGIFHPDFMLPDGTLNNDLD